MKGAIKMRTYDLEPNETNLTETLIKDIIGRRADVFSFVLLLHNIEDSCSISVDGRWGTGKTFFVKQCKLVLDAFNQKTGFAETDEAEKIRGLYDSAVQNNKEDNHIPFVTAYYDAWLHDDENDPLLSLMYEIMKENHNYYSDEIQRDWSEILASLADVISERSISDFVKALKGKQIFEKQIANEYTNQLIDSFLDSFLPEQGNKLVIFLDELDRCSPEYAIKLLERVKHHFVHKDVIFVFSVNALELQHTVKKFYGEGFDACRYLDWFFNIRTVIPPLDESRFIESLGINKNRDLREAVCFEVIRQMNMSMREMTRFLVMSKMATKKFSYENQRIHSFDNGMACLLGYDVVLPIVMGLKMTKTNEYEDFISGENGLWLEKIILTERLDSWIMGCLHADDRESRQNRETEKELEIKKNLIKNMYDAIFVETYEGGKFQVAVGKAIFEKGLKNNIIKAMGLVSPLTDYNV